jgi:hypothetical protein
MRNYWCVTALLLGMVSAIGITPALEATDYYVSTTGNDSNGCTVGAQCLTIQRGINVAVNPGDTVNVANGTYNERPTIANSGSAGGGKIIIRGYNNGNGANCPTTVDSDINSRGFRPNPGVTVKGFDVAADSTTYVRIECFHLIQNSAGQSGLDVGSHTGIHHIDLWDNFCDSSGSPGTMDVCTGQHLFSTASGSRAHDWDIERNRVLNTATGFFISCDNCTVKDNEIEQIMQGSSGSDQDYMQVFGDTIDIVHNYFHGTRQTDCTSPAPCHIDCTQVFTGPGDPVTSGQIAKNVTWERNVCFNADEGIIIRDEFNLDVASGNHTNWTVRNNVFDKLPTGDSSGGWCVYMGGMTNGLVYHNTCLTAAMFCTGTSSTCTYKDNIFYGLGNTLVYSVNAGASFVSTPTNNLLYSAGTTYSSGTFPNDVLNVDPLFVNLAGSNYAIQSGSPAKDAALNVGVAIDLIGTARPQGAGYDIGAYEVVVAGSSDQGSIGIF